MDIKREQIGDRIEFLVKGRLDAYWAEHLGGVLQEAIREGGYHLRLDLSEVDYVSSAGMRVLLKFRRQLVGIKGTFGITRASDSARDVLEMAGFADLLVEGPSPVETTAVRIMRPPSLGPAAPGPTGEATAGAASAAPGAPPPETLSTDRGAFKVRELRAGASLECRLSGDPSRLNGLRFGPEDLRSLACGPNLVALGLGAFGRDFADCRDRFGEFMAVAGAAGYLPTDGSGVPDYQISSGEFVPEVRALYSIALAGDFSRQARFESHAEGPLRLSELAGAALEVAGSDRAGVVILAESAGLLGAALKRSPVANGSSASAPGDAAPFVFPDVRQWLSFSPERMHARALALVVGVVSRGGGRLDAFVRPLAGEGSLLGHFHAAAFSYRPVARGSVDLAKSVADLFENESPQGLLHLVGDTREISGGGESEFVRGVMWVSPLQEAGG